AVAGDQVGLVLGDQRRSAPLAGVPCARAAAVAAQSAVGGCPPSTGAGAPGPRTAADRWLGVRDRLGRLRCALRDRAGAAVHLALTGPRPAPRDPSAVVGASAGHPPRLTGRGWNFAGGGLGRVER